MLHSAELLNCQKIKINQYNKSLKSQSLQIKIIISLSYKCPVYINISYILHFALLDNVQLSFPFPVLSLSDGGILHFKNKCSLPKPGYVFHSHPTPKIHLTEIPLKFLSIPPHSTITNCFKLSHNFQNHFDNYFDKHLKYLSTNTNNKLSDNYQIHQNSRNPEKYIKSSLIHHSPIINIKIKIIPQLSLQINTATLQTNFGNTSRHRTYFDTTIANHKLPT